jgi:hypothetical protein
MTPNDLIRLALKTAGVVGVGQTPLAENVNDAFTQLNMMLGQWNRRRWLVYHLIDTFCVSTGAPYYVVGLEHDFDVPRADRIESAFVRWGGTLLESDFSGDLSQEFGPAPVWSGQPIDRQIQVIQSAEDYSRISVKWVVGGPPQYVFLDSGYPFGKAYFYPVPPAGYELHLLLKAELPAFDTLADDVALPNEYQEAILYNLAARLRPQYGMPPEPTITALAKASLNTVRGANVQIPTLQMPAPLQRFGSRYNVYTDSY